MCSEIKKLIPGKNKHSHITCDITANDCNLQKWPHKMCWEIKQLIRGKNKHSHILVTLLRMTSITILPILATKWTHNVQILLAIFFWKGPKSIHMFRFKKMSNEDIKTYLGSLPNKSNNDILGMGLVSLRESAPYISISLANVINKSPKSGVSILSRTGSMPEWRLSIRMMVTLMTKISIVQYLS